MEDPVRFDLYGVPKPDALEEGKAMVAEAFPKLTRKALLQSFQRARADSESFCVSASLGWAEAENQASILSQCFEQIEIYQEGYGPDSECSYCDNHQLRYGGCLSCHVCNGFFAP